METNARRHPRINNPKVLVRIPSVEKFRAHYLKDLSQGGLFVRTEKPLALDKVVEIDLDFPGWSEPLPLHGRVVRVDSDEAAQKNNAVGFAVRFEDLLPTSEARLASLIAEHQPSESSPQTEKLRSEVQKLTFELSTAHQVLAEARPSSDADEGGDELALDGAPAERAHQRALRCVHRAERMVKELRELEKDAKGALAAAEEERASQAKREEQAQKEHQAALAVQRSESTARGEELSRALTMEQERSRRLERELVESRGEGRAKHEAQLGQLKADHDAQVGELRARFEAEMAAEQEKRAAAEQRLAGVFSQLGSLLGPAQVPGVLSQTAGTPQVKPKASAAAPGPVPAPAPMMNAPLTSLNVAPVNRPTPVSPLPRAPVTAPPAGASAAVTATPFAEAAAALLPPSMRSVASATPPVTEAIDIEADDLEADEAFEALPEEDALPRVAEPAPEAAIPLNSLRPTPAVAPEKTLVQAAASSDPASDFIHVEFTEDAPPARSQAQARCDFPQFLEQLKSGVGLKRLPKFNWHMPTDPAELQVMGWLENSDSFDSVRSLAKGRLGEDRLTQVMFDFYQRSIIDLAEAKRL